MDPLAQPTEDLCRQITKLIESQCQGQATPQRLFKIVSMVSPSAPGDSWLFDHTRARAEAQSLLPAEHWVHTAAAARGLTGTEGASHHNPIQVSKCPELLLLLHLFCSSACR